MNKAIWWIIGIVVVIIIVVPLVRTNKTGSNTFKVALSSPLSGSAAFAGESYRDGLMAAQKKINAEGGISGKQVELLIEDNKYDAKEGLSTYAKLVTQNPDIIILNGSVPVAAISPVAQKDGRAIFLAVNFADVTPKNEFAVSFYPTADDDSVATINDLKLNKITKLAVIYLNNEYGQAQMASIKEMAPKHGITIVAEESFLAGVSDFSTPLAKINTTKPQAIYVVAVSATPIIKQLKTYKTNAAIYTNNVPNSGNLINTDPEIYEGVHLTGYKSTIPGTPEYIKIREEISNANASNTLGYTAAAYDNLMAIREIMKKDPDPKNFVNTFSTFGKFDGINGGYDLNSRKVGMPLYPVVLTKGVLVEVK